LFIREVVPRNGLSAAEAARRAAKTKNSIVRAEPKNRP